MLEELQRHRIVHCDLKPANFVLFGDSPENAKWKLIDFDSACMEGEPVERGTLDYSAPEMLNRAPAAFSMDLFSLGRLIHWLSCKDGNMWPDLPPDASDADKRAFLASAK